MKRSRLKRTLAFSPLISIRLSFLCPAANRVASKVPRAPLLNTVSADGSGMEVLISDEHDNRDPEFTPDGRTLLAAGADVIALSALLSTTMLYQRDVVELLRNKGLKDKYYVLVGGAPVTQAWADEIGADGYAHDAFEAVQVLDEAMEGRAK